MFNVWCVMVMDHMFLLLMFMSWHGVQAINYAASVLPAFNKIICLL